MSNTPLHFSEDSSAMTRTLLARRMARCERSLAQCDKVDETVLKAAKAQHAGLMDAVQRTHERIMQLGGPGVKPELDQEYCQLIAELHRVKQVLGLAEQKERE